MERVVCDISPHQTGPRKELGVGLVLGLLPLREVEVLVEQQHCAGNEPLFSEPKHRIGAAVEVGVHVDEGKGSRVLVKELRKGVAEPTEVELGSVDVGKVLAEGACGVSLAPVPGRP